jgi:hypothetical protein
MFRFLDIFKNKEKKPHRMDTALFKPKMDSRYRPEDIMTAQI